MKTPQEYINMFMAQIKTLKAFLDPKNNATPNEQEIARKAIVKLKEKIARLRGSSVEEVLEEEHKAETCEPRFTVMPYRGGIVIQSLEAEQISWGVFSKKSTTVSAFWAYPEIMFSHIGNCMGFILNQKERELVLRYVQK